MVTESVDLVDAERGESMAIKSSYIPEFTLELTVFYWQSRLSIKYIQYYKIFSKQLYYAYLP